MKRVRKHSTVIDALLLIDLATILEGGDIYNFLVCAVLFILSWLLYRARLFCRYFVA